jgi:eukaryotic-like serine/threonine-protein kinase
VYLAEHTHDSSQVAIKILETRLIKSEDWRAFLNEVRAIRLRHPHIVPLLDFGLSREDVPFVVMVYAPRGSLRDRHPKGSRVPLSTAVEYATQVAADDVILLSDFGITTTAHSSHSLSINQSTGGTLPYMAPEQLEGKPRTESDQYALAVVVYEWLADVHFGGQPLKWPCNMLSKLPHH